MVHGHRGGVTGRLGQRFVLAKRLNSIFCQYGATNTAANGNLEESSDPEGPETCVKQEGCRL